MPSPLVIANLLKGIAKDYSGGQTAAVEGREFEYSRTGGIDFFRQGFEGHATSAQIFNGTAITHANINSHIRAAVTDNTQTTPFTYLILGGLSGTAPRIERLENGSYATTGSRVLVADGGHNFTTLPTGTSFWGEDIIIYNVSGTNRVFYSWKDSGDGDIGTGTLVAGAPTYTDNYFSTATGGAKLQADVPLRMVEGADRILYCTNGRYVASYDGSTATANPTRYDLGPGWIATDLRVYKGLLVIVAINCGSTYRITNFNQRSRVCLWNMTEPGLGLVYEINDGNASAAFVGEDGRLYCWSSKPGDVCRLRRFNGNDFEVVKEWIAGLYGTIPQPNGIESYRGLIIWNPGDSISSFIVAYDTRYNALHVPFFANDGTTSATTVGMVKNINASSLYISMLAGSTYELVPLIGSSGYGSTARDLRTRLYTLPYNSTITKFTFFLSQLASSAQVQFSLFTDYTAISVGTAGVDLLNFTLDNATYGAITSYELKRTITRVNSFYMNWRLTGQVSVRAIVIDYEPQK